IISVIYYLLMSESDRRGIISCLVKDLSLRLQGGREQGAEEVQVQRRGAFGLSAYIREAKLIRRT
ncbi:MAG: hypothetical protein RMZ42_34085, partial [Nostoc sp. DedQUE05]|uniref:hypothetical protein n=1 Tax=Nostoc sp. DedQUE05 TaxID=3075391 RepID=UPI002AD50485